MGAAALTARLPRRARAAAAADGEQALCFHAPGGPLVAVCGMVGGAGTSTLAYLLARRAARHSNAPILLGELQHQPALAALAGAASPLGLRDLAHALTQGQPVERPFTELDSGLRLVASARGAACEPVAPDALAQLLADAREAHGLVVLDTALNANPDTNALLETADHRLYVAPATLAALRRVELLAANGVFRSTPKGTVTLVAIAIQSSRGVSVKELRRLAQRHTDRLLLVPHSPELAAGRLDRAEPLLEDTFAALSTVLRGPG